MMRVLNRLAATVLAVIVVAAPPVLVFGWLTQQPWRELDVGDVRVWLADPPPTGLIWLLVATTGAGVWLLATAAVVRAAARAGRRTWRRLRRLELPTPAQATASSLVGVALLGIPGGTTAVTDSALPPATSTGDGHDTRPSTAGSETQSPQDGVDLGAHGWVPPHTAQQVAAMVGLFWLRRRQTYQPRPVQQAPGTEKDPRGLVAADPPMLPASVVAVTAAYPTKAAAPNVSDTATFTEQLPSGELRLSGPGASAAARGLFVTALMANTMIGFPRAHVVISAADLGSLLGESTPALPEIPGLHIGEDVEALITQPTVPDTDQLGAATKTRIVHLIHQADLPHRRGAPTEAVTVVKFGGEPKVSDNTWQVDADGYLITLSRSRRRLCMLDARTALDLLSLISQAHGLARADQPARAGAMAPPGRGDTSAPPARLRVLGDCTLTVHGRVLQVRRSAAWQILVWLAVHPEGATARELIEPVWPGLPAASITNRLYTTLYDLRSQLKEMLDRPLIIRRGDHHALDPAVVDVDLWHLYAAADTAMAAITTADRRRAREEALRHHGGELAADRIWVWLAGPRERVRNMVVDAYIDLTEQLDAAQALPLLHDAIGVDPYNEVLHRRAIAALVELGDHRAAARLRDTYTRRLTEAGLRITDPQD